MDTGTENRRIFTVSLAVLIILYLIRLYPLLDENSRLWGFNHLVFLPSACTVVFSILFAISLVTAFLPFARKIGETIIDGMARIFFESDRKWIYRLIFIVISVCLFIIFRAPTHFLGDGYSSIGNLASDTGTFYKWSEMGVTYMVSFIQMFIGPKNEYTARLAFQILSFVSGAVTIWFFFLIAQIISNRNTARVLAFTVMCISPVLLLFFGYVEYYPPLWMIYTAFLYACLHYMVREKGVLIPLLLIIAGIFIHMQIGIFIVAYLFLVFSTGNGAKFYRRFKALIWSAIGILAIIMAIIFIKRYTGNLYFEHIFLPLFNGKPVDPYYLIFSGNHLLDILNELLLLSPALPVLIVISIGNFRKIMLNRTAVFLGLAATLSLLFLLVIDPKLGLARDWDLFSLSSFGVGLLAITMITDSGLKVVRRMYIPILILLLCATVAYLAVNLNRNRSIDYFKYTINIDINRSFSSLVALHNYYKGLGDEENRKAVNDRIKKLFPEKPMTQVALDLLEKHKIDEAEEIIKMIPRDKFSSQYHNLMSMYYLALNKFPQALEESDKVMQLSKYNFVYHRNRAWIYTVMQRDDLALLSLRKAYDLNNTDLRTIEGLAANYLRSDLFDSTDFYCRKLINQDSSNIGAYFLLARMFIQLNRPDSARNYLQLYLRYGSSDSLNMVRAGELKKVIEYIENRYK